MTISILVEPARLGFARRRVDRWICRRKRPRLRRPLMPSRRRSRTGLSEGRFSSITPSIHPGHRFRFCH